MKRLMICLAAFMLLFSTACSQNPSAETVVTASQQDNQKQEGTKESPPAKEQMVQLRMGWWGSQERHNITMKAIKLFEERNPNIKVTPEYSGYDGYMEKLATQVAGGNAPDVITMAYESLLRYATQGALMDLTSKVQTADISSVLLDTGKVDGKLSSLINSSSTLAVVYNEDLFKKLNLTPPGESWSWEQFGKLANQIAQAKGKGFYGVSDNAGDISSCFAYVLQNGETFFTTDGKLGVSRQVLIDWFTLWHSLRKNGAIPDAETTASISGVEQNPILTGKAGMSIIWNSQFGNFQSLMKDGQKLAYQLIPTMSSDSPKGQYLIPSQYFSVFAKSKHPEEALKLVDFLVNDIDAGKILGMTRGVPTNSKVNGALHDILSKTDAEVVRIGDLASKNVTMMDPIPPQGYSEISSMFIDLSGKIAFEKMPIDKAVDEFINKANTVLAKK